MEKTQIFKEIAIPAYKPFVVILYTGVAFWWKYTITNDMNSIKIF
jgi:hypothetical protein